MDQDGTWHGGRPRPKSQLPPIKKGHGPNFRPMSDVANRLDGSTYHLVRRQASPIPHYVRWGPSSPTYKGAQPPLFSPCLLLPNGGMDQDSTWYEGKSRPKPHCVTWGSSSRPHLTQCGEGRGMPSSILTHPTVCPQYTNVTDRTDRQDRQRSDSIGRTVLQTVAQKPAVNCKNCSYVCGPT